MKEMITHLAVVNGLVDVWKRDGVFRAVFVEIDVVDMLSRFTISFFFFARIGFASQSRCVTSQMKLVARGRVTSALMASLRS